MTTQMTIPDRSEAAEYYFTYIDKVGPGDIREIIRAQEAEIVSLLEGIDEEKSLYRYEPGKWSIRELVSHCSDTERVFVFRALWFGRGFADALPSFDQNIAAAGANADKRPLKDHIAEFRAVRSATIAFFDSLPDEAWGRRGIASGNEVTVRALAYIVAGHVAHQHDAGHGPPPHRRRRPMRPLDEHQAPGHGGCGGEDDGRRLHGRDARHHVRADGGLQRHREICRAELQNRRPAGRGTRCRPPSAWADKGSLRYRIPPGSRGRLGRSTRARPGPWRLR